MLLTTEETIFHNNLCTVFCAAVLLYGVPCTSFGNPCIHAVFCVSSSPAALGGYADHVNGLVDLSLRRTQTPHSSFH